MKMLRFNNSERVRTKNRFPLLLNALQIVSDFDCIKIGTLISVFP